MMKFLADENIPLETVTNLRKNGIDIHSVIDRKVGMNDDDVLSLSNKEKRILVTYDKDFCELIFKRKERCEGIILLRIHPQPPRYTTQILEKILTMNINFTKSFSVVEINRVRVIPLNY